jgi:ABC-type phosphate transport system substrate-binding protein
MLSERLAGTLVVLCFVLLLLPSCGGGSNSPPPQNPAPVIQSISPATIAAGTPGLTLTISGSNFLSNSTVSWNGAQ